MINITIRTNRDRAVVERVRKALRENNGYCPCSLVKDEDHKCMCKEFIEQESGFCYCGLYEKVEN